MAKKQPVHDYQTCVDDDCTECKIIDNKAKLREVVAKRAQEQPPTGAIKRAALNLLQQGPQAKLAMSLMLGVTLLFSGCRGLSAEGEAEVRRMIAGNDAIVAAADAPAGAKEVAQDNSDALKQLLYHEGEEDNVPDDVRARREARRPQ